jgi:L-arabonate dehydrase
MKKTIPLKLIPTNHNKAKTSNGSKLRSAQWFGRADEYGFIYRSWTKNRGIPHDQFEGKPVIGICNTYGDTAPCNSHFREIAQQVRYGILEAGGFPMEFPVMTLGESLLRPTAMMYRNLVSMDVEESIRGNPIDGVVLLVGCDKTTPALLMGAASADVPAIAVSGGPMLSGKYKGQELGSGTSVWKMRDDLNAGKMKLEEFHEAESCMHRSHGHCMTMGTASTMASMVESLGIGMPGNAAYPAVDGRRMVLARMAGRRAVELVKKNVKISDILTRPAFENAIRTLAAIGGSTNAVVHLIAIAKRLGVKLDLADFDKLGRGVHTIVNMMPAGEHLMEDFCYAGGLPVVLRILGEQGLLNKKAMTVNGETMWANVKKAENYNTKVITPWEKPFKKNTGIAVLQGNLAPNGAIIKPSAATPKLMKHKGRAMVFEDFEDLHKKLVDPKLDVDENSVLVLKNCGPKGYPGFAEVGNMPMPTKLVKKGITDMVRISDARMSGTAYGTVVLHVAPEAAAGGPLGLVQTGDIIELDVEKRVLQLHVSEEELAKRRAKWVAPPPHDSRGYWKLYYDHVNQADEGADFDFLVGKSGAFVPRDNH